MSVTCPRSSAARTLMVAAAALLGFTAQAALGYAVHFDQDVYQVLPLQSFEAQVLFDFDQGTPGDQLPPSGLFSMGVEVSYLPYRAEVVDEADIVVPDPLDGDGTGGPALKRVESGLAGVSGALDLGASSGYMSPLLATFTIHDLGPETYTLNLDFFFRDTRVNFLDFEGNVLDGGITFHSAMVEIVPEPGTMSLLFASLLLGWSARRHRRS